jgi:hypothetical protein
MWASIWLPWECGISWHVWFLGQENLEIGKMWRLQCHAHSNSIEIYINQNLFNSTTEKSKGFWKKVWVDVRFPIKSSTNDFLETIYGNQPYKSNNHYRNKIYKIKIPKQILCIKQAITLWALENVASWHILFCISFLLVKVWHSQGLHGADTSGLIWS